MIQIESWAAEFAQKLQKAFGQRLLFLGYQGSYGRGEATDHSDIDIVTVLDQAAPADLDQYRELVRSMPQGELACGFLCGREELAGPGTIPLGCSWTPSPWWEISGSFCRSRDRSLSSAWETMP